MSLDFRAAYNRIEKHIEERYGIPVSTADVLDPNTGDFDGARILIDYDQDLETAFFVLAHLFGHTVQWNLSEDYRLLGQDSSPGKSDAEMERIFEYEHSATRYSLQLMYDAGLTGFDAWLTDMWWADWTFLKQFYKNGERLPFASCMKKGVTPVLTPLKIPVFTPTKWVSRWSF